LEIHLSDLKEQMISIEVDSRKALEQVAMEADLKVFTLFDKKLTLSFSPTTKNMLKKFYLCRIS
jgi:hypothetical protein